VKQKFDAISDAEGGELSTEWGQRDRSPVGPDGPLFRRTRNFSYSQVP
jgi:hypothetical protein